MKKLLSATLSAILAAGAVTMLPSSAATAPLLTGDFESGLNGWSARGTASVELTQTNAANGIGAASVTNRANDWCGISHALDPAVIKPGGTYVFRASVFQQSTPLGVHFKLSLQYNTGGFGGDTFDCIAEGTGAAGTWLTLSNNSYTIPANAQNMTLYLETEGSETDFLADEIYVRNVDIFPDAFETGDADHSGRVDRQDVFALRDYLTGKTTGGIYTDTADLDRNGVLNAADLTLLKQMMLQEPQVTTTTVTEQTTVTTVTTVTVPDIGTHAQPKAYMEKVRSQMKQDVPADVQRGDTGTTTHITYYSKKANRDKGANIWLPAGYSENQKYPVLYMNHGIMGDENGMLNGFAVREMASNLIAKGEAVPFIIVFPQMYTDPAQAMPGGFDFTMNTMDHYDDFLYDLTESLMPYVESHYSVKTGRENTAIAGFSMGGRESLYIGMHRPDAFGYVCASSPAPGIVPGVDTYLTHLGSYIPGTQTRMTEQDFRIADDKLPYLLMIAGGTNDMVVGTFPKQYHELFTKNGTDHIWTEVPGGQHDGSVGIPLFYNFFRAVFQA